jgi:AraC family transcriptional regulator
MVMGLMDKVAWYVETNLDNPVTLQAMAEALGVSHFHLAHSFAMLSGQPVMRYVWRRRLSRSAVALVQTNVPVIRIALDAGYASPEAFTRAFRAEFGLSPRKLRQQGGLHGLKLTHPLEVQPMTTRIFTAPTPEPMPALVFAGPVQRYDMQTRSAIPAQWDAYNQADLRAASPKPEDYFGIVFNFAEDKGAFDYMCGQFLTQGAALPLGFKTLKVPAGAWARFVTTGHISTMQNAWGEVMGHWLGQPGLIPREGPSIEYYPPHFDGMSGNGGYEIWVPVKAA